MVNNEKRFVPCFLIHHFLYDGSVLINPPLNFMDLLHAMAANPYSSKPYCQYKKRISRSKTGFEKVAVTAA
jgi:hypothetical protein